MDYTGLSGSRYLLAGVFGAVLTMVLAWGYSLLVLLQAGGCDCGRQVARWSRIALPIHMRRLADDPMTKTIGNAVPCL